MLLQSDANEFRTVQAEMKKAGAHRSQQQLLSKPLKAEKRSLPSFLKRPPDKRRREGADDLETGDGRATPRPTRVPAGNLRSPRRRLRPSRPPPSHRRALALGCLGSATTTPTTTASRRTSRRRRRVR